jgi:hypothetical protein
MLSKVRLLSRRSPQDLEITFKNPKGEAVTLFVDLDELAGRTVHEKAQALASDLGCALCCSRKTGYAACLARCLVDGRCCNSGIDGCEDA